MFNKTSTLLSINKQIRYLFGNFHDLFTDEEINDIANYCKQNYHEDLVPYLSSKLQNKVSIKDELELRLEVGL
jgi:hypothetical protein